MKALVIANKKHLKSNIPGGVQLCTNDFIQLFSEVGFQLSFFPVLSTTKITHRLCIKLGIENYQKYDAKGYLDQIITKLETENIDTVIINQVNLFRFAQLLKKQNPNLKIICWSHGNESGDFLHTLTRETKGILKTFVQTLQLGRYLKSEATAFQKYIDYLFVISETEKHVNHWLGANKVMYIPYRFKPEKFHRAPQKGVFGFMGTLNHPPNYMGFQMLCEELCKLDTKGIKIKLIGGPKKEGEKFQKKYPFVDYLGFLPEDQVLKEIITWSYFLNPVFWYSRGASTKLAYAVNKGIPVISTPAGNRGYIIHNKEIITCSNAIEFAKTMLSPSDIDSEKMHNSSNDENLLKTIDNFLKS